MASTPSVVLVAIAAAARQLGRPDPLTLSVDLLDVDVDALDEWFAVADRVRVRLWRGAAELSGSLSVLAAGWSNPAPRRSVLQQRAAGIASRDVLGPQVDAADQAASVLRQGRLLACADIADAEAAVTAMGWPPGEDLLLWAAADGSLALVCAVVVGLAERLDELTRRNNDAVLELAIALRADPRDPVGLLVNGSAAGTPQSDPQRSPARPGQTPDRVNLDRLDADLHSTDASTVLMAAGVTAALERARQNGATPQLLVYESADQGSQGRAAISVGDVGSADNVAVLAPGVMNSPVGIADGVANAITLRDAALAQAPGDATAVVAWYGYDIPLSAVNGVPMDLMATAANLASAVDDGNARAGGALLADDLAAMRELAPEHARFVGIGFSMGSTTVSAAAARGATFDDLVLMGSPGASREVSSADDYPVVPAEHTFVTAFDNDPVTGGTVDLLAGLAGGPPLLPMLGGSFSGQPFGPDPADADFGAQVIDVDTNAADVSAVFPPLTPLAGLLGLSLADEIADVAAHHSEANYLTGESLAAVAAVTTGRYSQVPIKPGR